MKSLFKKLYFISSLSFVLLNSVTYGQNLDAYKYNGMFDPDANKVYTNFQFNGYTNYWHDTYRQNIRYGNLFQIAIPKTAETIAQSKVDVAEDLKIPGLSLQEGFLNNLLNGQYLLLDQPSLQKLNESCLNSNVLVLVDPETEVGKKLTGKLPKDDGWKDKLKSHQAGAKDFTEVNGFYLENNNKRIYVIASKSKELRDKASELIVNAKSILEKYDLRRGWFGAGTLLKSVTITPGHPLDVIARGMNEGNSWFTFSGYMDFLAQKEIENWLAKVNLQIATDAGANIGYVAGIGTQAIYGCDDYDGLQPQNMYTIDSWLRFARNKHGYSFRSVYDPAADPYHYDGYIAGEGNKEQIDDENVPFITTTGYLEDDAVPCMMLFLKKGEQLEGVTVKTIYTDRAVFSNENEETTIKL